MFVERGWAKNYHDNKKKKDNLEHWISWWSNSPYDIKGTLPNTINQ